MISIILQCYDFNKSLRHMSIACLGDIKRFADIEHEIIVVDNEPKFELRDDYKIGLWDKLIVNDKDKGCFGSYNQGAKEAKGNILVFIQNDVFLHEQCLDKLYYYLAPAGEYPTRQIEPFDVAYPQQLELTREQVALLGYHNPDTISFGFRDAGLMMITKKGFEKTGGWNNDIKTSIIGWKDMFERIDKAGLKWTCQTNGIVTHIKAGNNLMKETEQYNKELDKESKILK